MPEIQIDTRLTPFRPDAILDLHPIEGRAAVNVFPGSLTYGAFVMRITELFWAQLEREAALSRRVLERVPEGRPEWKPHEKSMPLGYLSTLVATMPSWIAMTVLQDSLDLNPPGGSPSRPREYGTTGELLKALDEAVSGALEALGNTTDDHLMTPWKLLVGGRTVMEQPRHVVIADTFNHQAHHRGQLTVYLRLNEVLVPSVYGPSADEGSFV